MSVQNLENVFRPKSIALFGAAGPQASVGGVLARNLFGGGFDGPIVPIATTERAIQGVLAYPSVDAMPLVPDLALIASPAGEVPALLTRLGARGTRAAIVYSTDFGTNGTEAGRQRHQLMLDAARPHGLRVVGPACLGVIMPSLGVDASYAQTRAAAGDLAFVTESGSILDAMLGWAAARGVGFSLAASLGDMADVDVGDVLDYLTFDHTTRAVLLYIERIPAPRKFLSAARALARLKPVVVYRPAAVGEPPVSDVAGRPLVGSDIVFDAAFQRAGMLPVTQVGDLIAAAQTLGTRMRLDGEHLSIIANGRGLGTAVADVVHSQGGVLSVLTPPTLKRLDAVLPPGWGGRNPVNVFGDADADRYRAALEALLADEATDVILATLGPTATGDRRGAALAVAETLAGAKKPGIAIWFGGVDTETARAIFAPKHVPVYDRSGAAISAILQLVSFRRNQDMLMETPASTPELFSSDVDAARRVVEGALAAGREELDTDEVMELLGAYRVPMAASRPTAGTAAGGIETAGTRMRTEALRIAVGINASFGPIIVFGPGGLPPGVDVDRAVALPPLNLTLAYILMAQTRVGQVLVGYGPELERTRAEIALALIKISQILTDLPGVVGLDIDPLLADSGGICAERCRIRVARPGTRPGRHFAIRPYPRQLEKTVTMRDGRSLTLRPIRPEDEPALRRFVRNLDPDDVRLRFFAAMKELDHRFAARLTQIDYDREMAFVAVDAAAEDAGICGVMRIIANTDNTAAEFAGAVRSDLKGQGLGRLLMEEIVAYARRRGIKEVWGTVLAENTAMLQLVRSLGFTLKTDADDPAIVYTRLSFADSGDEVSPSAG